MKKLTTAVLASVVLVSAAFAGQEIYDGKASKKEIPLATCFNDQELQVDVFGVWTEGNAQTHAGPTRDHGWGGGIGVNYFFHRYIGVGAEGYWIAAETNRDVPNGHDDDERSTFHNVNGSLIFRLPIDSLCLAPYAYLGGGAVLNGENWAVGFAGVGLEYRVVPHKIGLFVDARWNYYGDRHGDGDQNNFTTRAGVRWVF